MPEANPAPPRTAPDPLARISSPVLRSAAGRVLARVSDDADGGLPATELGARLADLAAALEAERAGPPPQEPGGFPAAPSSAELLEMLLEAELAERLEGGTAPSLPELLQLLRSASALRKSLAAAAAPGAEPTFDDPAVVVGLAHDLRSPLTSVLFLSDALRSGYAGSTSEVQRRQLGIIYSAALGLVSMANDILDLYRRGDNLVDQRPSPFSIAEIVDSIRDIVLPIAEERRIDLRFSLPAEQRHLGRPVALARVLLNLVVNGLKYTESGFVEVSARPTGASTVEFSVRDSGSGIRPEEEATLFQPLRRVNRWNGPGFSGTGLGLALARRLVRAMDSELEYETAPGAGTRFFFELDLPAAPPA